MSIQALELALVTIFGDGGLIVADCKYHNICKLTATHGDYCILHSPDETKDRLEFKTAFQKHWHESNDFSHFVFTFTFPPKILTEGSHHEKFTLDSAKLDHAVFKGNVKCENISIIDCSFSSAEFEKEAFFKDVKFLGKTTFTSAVFFENAIFKHSSFADETSFYYTLFEKVLYLDNITFMGKSNFANVQIIPDNPNTFITFKEVTFSDYVNFNNAKIFGRIDFSSTRFNKEAIFWKSDFRGLSSFSSCEFHGNLILFDESSFQHKQTTFFRCQFHNGPSFKKTEFGGPVVFENTEFYNGVRFVDTVFKREVTFDETLFKGYSLFEGTEKPIFSNTKVVFKDVILDPPETLNIRNADFKKTTLTQLNLEKASLTAITWPKKGLFISRNCIFDEKNK
jgi:uncharacterized protein YjbI with pentapeptide repeats